MMPKQTSGIHTKNNVSPSPLVGHIKQKMFFRTKKYWQHEYCKFENFREGFIFAKLHEVSWKQNLREMAKSLCRLLI